MNSDGDLVRQTLAGRAQAYEELVRHWAARIVAVCHARVGQADAADDLAQETLLRGYRALGSLAEPEKFGAWLCGIATNACRDWLKSRQRTQIPFSVLGANQNVDELVGSDPRADGSALDREEELSQLMAAVEALPDECREVILLYYYEDVTYRQLAEALGVSAATINARLTKARMLLRERLGDQVRR
jgi:RNA polymerase sigma-70 factor (ECF subfamily)